MPKNYSKLKKKKFILFSGIGNPHTFSDTLKRFKIKFDKYQKFPDHYDYKESDLQKLKKLAKNKNCELLTTEKDYFRIKKSLRKNINFLKVELSVDQEKRLLEAMDCYIKEKKIDLEPRFDLIFVSNFKGKQKINHFPSLIQPRI